MTVDEVVENVMLEHTRVKEMMEPLRGRQPVRDGLFTPQQASQWRRHDPRGRDEPDLLIPGGEFRDDLCPYQPKSTRRSPGGAAGAPPQ